MSNIQKQHKISPAIAWLTIQKFIIFYCPLDGEHTKISGGVIPFTMGLLACVAVILMVAGVERRFGRGMDFLAKYTMPIFLMHTMFAASTRAVLLKLGIGSSVIHVVLGLGISFIGPIIAAWIMKKTKWLEFFLYPNKFVKIRN